MKMVLRKSRKLLRHHLSSMTPPPPWRRKFALDDSKAHFLGSEPNAEMIWFHIVAKLKTKFVHHHDAFVSLFDLTDASATCDETASALLFDIVGMLLATDSPAAGSLDRELRRRRP